MSRSSARRKQAHVPSTVAKIKLRPIHEDPLGTHPYLYWIDSETGLVGRQEFWKGAPLRLIGFAEAHEPYDIAVLFVDFVQQPDLVAGMHPVFEHADGRWYTYDLPAQAEGVVQP